MATTLWVTAAVMLEHDRVLLTQRKPGGDHPGLWEFPGGKVRDGEAPRAAMIAGADSASNDRGCSCPESNRDTRNDHQDWKAETERGQLTIADLSQEPGIDESLRHHHRDTKQNRHRHVDQVSAYRSLG